MTYDFYSDPGHGWLKVPLAEVRALMIRQPAYSDPKPLSEVITSCSYERGAFAYLEEDQDMTAFITAKRQIGEDVKIRPQLTAKRESRIRNYPSFFNWSA